MPSNAKISEMFRRAIFSGLEKVDSSQVGQRKSVYEAALKSLNNVHAKNPDLTEDMKINQRNELSELIIEIEAKISNLNNEENSLVPDIESVSQKNENEYLLTDEINTESATGSISDKMQTSLSGSKLFGKTIYATIVFALLAAIGIFTYYGSPLETENSADKLPLPYVLNADQALLDYGKPRDNGSIRLSNNSGEGIVYEVDTINESVANRVDFVLKDRLGKEIVAHDEPILVTLHVQKISKEDIELNLLYRGSGKIVRKSVGIVDEETNEFFFITNAERDDKERSAALIRLQIVPTSEKFEEKPVLLLKKIIFSKI